MKVWILVLVKRGFIQQPELFRKYKDAKKRMNLLLQDFNRDYDEIEIFPKSIDNF